MKELLSMAAFAKLHQVSRAAVTKWKKRHLLIFEGDKVDVAASNAMLKKYRSARRQEIRSTIRDETKRPAEDEIPGQLIDLLVAGLEADIDLTEVSITVEGVTMLIAEPGLLKKSYLALKRGVKTGCP